LLGSGLIIAGIPILGLNARLREGKE